MPLTKELAENIIDYVHALSYQHHISKTELFEQALVALTREYNRLEASDPDRNR